MRKTFSRNLRLFCRACGREEREAKISCEDCGGNLTPSSLIRRFPRKKVCNYLPLGSKPYAPVLSRIAVFQGGAFEQGKRN